MYNCVGHGSKNQIADVPAVERELDQLAQELNRLHGTPNQLPQWAVCYGGDPADEKNPDIGYIVRYLARKHSVKIIAIQCDECV